MDHAAYVVQSLCDRVGGLVVDVDKLSAELFLAGNVELAHRLDALAQNLSTARVLFEHAQGV